MPEVEYQELRDRVIRENPFMTYNHIEVGPVRPDYAEVSMTICRESTNIYHVVHGGAFFTMTQDAAVQFIHNVSEGTVTARGSVLSRGKRICLVNVDITDQNGTLLFHGTVTMYCIRP